MITDQHVWVYGGGSNILEVSSLDKRKWFVVTTLLMLIYHLLAPDYEDQKNEDFRRKFQQKNKVQ